MVQWAVFITAVFFPKHFGVKTEFAVIKIHFLNNKFIPCKSN